jgi:uncharacterized protein YlxW (UPF0749 family)
MGGPRGTRLRGLRLVRPRHARRPIVSTVLVGITLGLAGTLFVTSAQTARGTQLRSDRSDSVGLIRAESERLDSLGRQVKSLRVRIDDTLRNTDPKDRRAATVRTETDRLLPVAGMTAVGGPGLRITLDDARQRGVLPPGVSADDLVVHQQDVQAVVNALWAGGAEALQLMDQRVISTSAVRCVGNTLILQGRVYSPPYTITAIGPVSRMRSELDRSPQIGVYKEYVDLVGLTWKEEDLGQVTLPGFTASLERHFAKPVSSTVSPPRASTDFSNGPS